MKKSAPVPELIELIPAEEISLAQVIPIRTETTLTRFPIHRIAKKGDVRIKQTKQNAKGKVITVWEVNNPPSSLAYKLDTVVINRRLDELRPNIATLIKLGSLRDICLELGINPSGKNTNSIREALHENGSAYIRAKLDYKGSDGIERTFEFGTTRYTVIFTGEKLPNGKKADAVYIELHPRFQELLRHSKTRPLDYTYLKELPLSAQRLYELLSFAMFGTLTHGRPNAQMFYSEFCQSAPLTRHFEFFRVRSQMRKIHQPHIESGYLKAVDFEETTDAEGQPDWLIRYTPGRKAKHEFKEFTTKKLNAPSLKPRLVSLSQTQESTPSVISQDDAALASLLCQIGVVEKKAYELAQNRRADVERELEAWPHRDQSKMNDPAAWLIKAIESGNYSLPATAKATRTRKATAQKQSQLEVLREQYADQYCDYLRSELDALKARHEKAYNAFNDDFAQFANLPFEQDDSDRDAMRVGCFERFITENPGLEILTFEQWIEAEKPKA